MEDEHMYSIWGAQFKLCISQNRILHTYFISLKADLRKDIQEAMVLSSLVYTIYALTFLYLVSLLLKLRIFLLNPMAFGLHLLFTKFSFVKGNLNLMRKHSY